MDNEIPATPPFEMRYEDGLFYAFDNIHKLRLPYESADETFIKGIVDRLISDYASYVGRISLQ